MESASQFSVTFHGWQKTFKQKVGFPQMRERVLFLSDVFVVYENLPFVIIMVSITIFVVKCFCPGNCFVVYCTEGVYCAVSCAGFFFFTGPFFCSLMTSISSSPMASTISSLPGLIVTIREHLRLTVLRKFPFSRQIVERNSALFVLFLFCYYCPTETAPLMEAKSLMGSCCSIVSEWKTDFFRV